MSSRSGSDSESGRSGSPINHGPVPTPGHELERSGSISPQFRNTSGEASQNRGGSRNSRSRSGSPASSGRSRSGSAESNKSGGSGVSNQSRKSRSRSVASERSKRSQSAESNRSGSAASQKSGAASQRSGSNRSGSGVSRRSSSGGSKNRSRSGSPQSNKSGSRSRSGSPHSNKSRSKSGTPQSNKSRSRSGSGQSHKSRSRSKSAQSNKSRSRSGSARSNKSRSRSRSVHSNKSGSRSRSGSRQSNKSKSRSGSAASNRSRSGTPASNQSRRSGSGSPSPAQEKVIRSGSASPNLEIDEPGSPGSPDKRKRESSEEKTVKKKSRIIDSDSEDDQFEKAKENDKAEVSAAAIFGDADDISSEEEKDKDESDREVHRRSIDEEEDRRRSDEENEMRQLEEEGEKEVEPEPIPETRIDVEIPKISCDLGRDIHFVKLPNFLSVETRPFDPETYEDEIDEEETLDEEGRARLKLKVENTIRWKEIMDKEGNITKQSNARLVRWSDGSYSLHLGSEIFDVYKQPLQGDHNHLFIRQGTGLQGQAVFRTKLSFRPHSTESFTHRKMTLSLADRSQKTSGIKILSQVGVDPDHDRKTLLKKEEEKLRQTVRVSKPRTRKGDTAPRSLNSSAYREEEGSDEEGAISLNAIKNKYKSGSGQAQKGGAIYSSDEEGSDIETRKPRKVDKTKALKDSESSGDDSE